MNCPYIAKYMEGTMKRVLIISLVLVFAAAGLAYAQTDFTGTWVLDASKSDMGETGPMARKMPAQKIVLVIKQTANLLTIERSVNGKKDTAVFKLDGSESSNPSPSGHVIKTWMKWAGNTLVSKSTMDMGSMKTEMNDVRSLSANGKVMTIQLTQQMPSRVVKKTLIYNKQ
jgi:hypothetical protein